MKAYLQVHGDPILLDQLDGQSEALLVLDGVTGQPQPRARGLRRPPGDQVLSGLCCFKVRAMLRQR